MKRVYLLIICLSFNLYSLAQKEANNWYFGSYAGITFNGPKVTALTNSNMYAWEGCTAMSDKNGELLFYTNGVYVVDRTHKVTPNGHDLLGAYSATQGVVIVPKPGSDKLYYIFTVDQISDGNGLLYSVFDLSLNSGKGDIVPNQKNIKLWGNVYEKLTVTQHQNKRDYWVLTHEFYSDKIFAFLVTSSGISPTPVISQTGLSTKSHWNSTLGYLKVSPDGTKIAYANWTFDSCGFGNFDAKSGVVSNIWSFKMDTAYGIEFSPKSNYLYVGEEYKFSIYQFNAKAKTKSDFQLSKKLVDERKPRRLGAMQLGPDKQIYVARQGSEYLDIIQNPDSAGKACNFQHDYVYLSGQNCYWGLPSFIQAYFYFQISHQPTCQGDTAWFDLTSRDEYDSVQWNFGDKGSGIYNSTKGLKTFHLYSDTGIFNVRAIGFKGSVRDTAYTKVDQYRSKISFSLGIDTTLGCKQKIKLGHFDAGFMDYLWNDQSTAPFLTADSVGSYWLKIKDQHGCIHTDTIEISYLKTPKLDLDPAQGICENMSLILDFTNRKNQEKYLWSTSDTTPVVNITKTGNYWVKAMNDCGQDSVNFSVTLQPKPIPDFNAATDVCEGKELKFGNKSVGGKIFEWRFGDGTISNDSMASHKYAVTQKSRTYLVTLVAAYSKGCQDSITKPVNVQATSDAGFSYQVNDNTVFFSQTTSDANNAYKWHFGDGDSSSSVNPVHNYKTSSGTYSVCLQILNPANCQSKACKTVYFNVGINEIIKDEFMVFPNPTEGTVHLAFSNPASNATISIFNLLVELVLEKKDFSGLNAQLDMSHLPEGVYLIRVYTSKTNVPKRLVLVK